MAEESDEDKTEDPSHKKLSDARAKGQVPLSRELNSWLILATAALMTGTVLGKYADALADRLKVFIAQPHIFIMDSGGMHNLLIDVMKTIGVFVLMPIGALLIAGIMAPMLQVGPLLVWDQLSMKWNKLNPINGAKRLMSMQSIVELVKGLLKLTIIGSVTAVILMPYINHGESLVGQDLSMILAILRKEIVQLFIVTLSIMIVVAGADYAYQRYQWYKSLKMSKTEAKEEYRQAEGDPHVKGKIKQMRVQKARQRMMARVPEASVVITNPTHYAVALEYDREKMNAPVVAAKGLDHLALRIRELAKENDVPIVENPPLARGLYAGLEIDDEITEEHYKAVAEVISYVYSLKKR